MADVGHPTFATRLNLRVIRIATASLVTGVMIGLVGGAFRYCLRGFDGLRDAVVHAADAWPYTGWLMPVDRVLADIYCDCTIQLLPCQPT